MTNKELATDLRNLYIPVSLYIVNVTEVDTSYGYIDTNTSCGPYKDYDAAIAAMRKMYEEELERYDLEDNGACDENDENIPGGYFTDKEAGIYLCAEFAFGEPRELINFSIQRIDIKPDMQDYIHNNAAERKAARPELIDENAEEHAKKILALAEEHKALSAEHPEWTAEDHRAAAEELWKKINEESE